MGIAYICSKKEEKGLKYDNITEHNRRNCHRTGIRTDEQAGAEEEALQAEEELLRKMGRDRLQILLVKAPLTEDCSQWKESVLVTEEQVTNGCETSLNKETTCVRR